MVIGVPFHKTPTLLVGKLANNGMLVVQCLMFEYITPNLTYIVTWP
jgi:hypothetical protein